MKSNRIKQFQNVLDKLSEDLIDDWSIKDNMRKKVKNSIATDLKEIKRIVDVFEKFPSSNYDNVDKVLSYCSSLQTQITRLRAWVKDYKNIK